jgi:hypothetical protein
MLPQTNANNFQTTLAAAITTAPAAGTVETWTFNGTLPSALQVPGQFTILIDSELMLVTSTSGSNPWSGTLIRGSESTAIATHANGALVTALLTVGSLTAMLSTVSMSRLEAFGESIEAGYLNQGYQTSVQRLGQRLGAHLTLDYAVAGSVGGQDDNHMINSPVQGGGWQWTARHMWRPYPGQTDLSGSNAVLKRVHARSDGVIVKWLLNDIAQTTNTVYHRPCLNGIRYAMLRARASHVETADNSGGTLTFGANYTTTSAGTAPGPPDPVTTTNGIMTGASIKYSGNNTGQTAANSITITVPAQTMSNYATTYDLFVIFLQTGPTTGADFSFTIDGGSAITGGTTKSQGHGPGYTPVPVIIRGLSASSSHTIVFWPTNITETVLGLVFDCYGIINPLSVPAIAVVGQYLLPSYAGFSGYANGPNVNDTAVINGRNAMASMLSETLAYTPSGAATASWDSSCQYVDLSPMDKDTTCFASDNVHLNPDGQSELAKYTEAAFANVSRNPQAQEDALTFLPRIEEIAGTISALAGGATAKIVQSAAISGGTITQQNLIFGTVNSEYQAWNTDGTANQLVVSAVSDRSVSIKNTGASAATGAWRMTRHLTKPLGS